MDVFTYDGIVRDYVAEDGLFAGSVKKYSMHLANPSNFYFWYVTDLDDQPVEQGEGPCAMYNTNGTRDCGGPPKMLFHQYHQETFKEAVLDDAVFALPPVCQTTKTTCLVEPTSSCG